MGWKALKPGEMIDVVAPGSPCKLKDLKSGLNLLLKWGLKPRVSKDIFRKQALPYLSQSDMYRFKDLKNAILSLDSKAIWCVRGGYGSLRLLPYLERMKKPSHSKILIGYSDITSLQLFLDQSWNWQSLHGPFLENIGTRRVSQRDRKEIKNILFGDIHSTTFYRLKALNAPAQKRGIIKGKIRGGNLTVLQSSLGTQQQIKGRGRILFFEDLGERGYRIDRILTHMLQGNVFQSALAVIFGDFIGGRERDGRFLSMKCLKEFSKNMKIPVFKGLPCGHGKIQRPLILNSHSEIQIGETIKLIVSVGRHK